MTSLQLRHLKTAKTQETPLVRNILNVNGCQNFDDHSLGCVTPDESPFKMLCIHQGSIRSTLGIKQSVGSQPNIRLKKTEYSVETIYTGGVIMG